MLALTGNDLFAKQGRSSGGGGLATGVHFSVILEIHVISVIVPFTNDYTAPTIYVVISWFVVFRDTSANSQREYNMKPE